VEWRASRQTESRARQPIFREITNTAIGGTEAFRRQLNTPLDAWMTTLDAVLTRDSNGHHGVSVGDADGDGLDDLYVAQPAGLPNRLFRASGDGTFEDAPTAPASASSTTRRSRCSPTSTTTATRIWCWHRQRSAAVHQRPARPLTETPTGPRRLPLRPPLQGRPHRPVDADFDRDGFLDVYLCVYILLLRRRRGESRRRRCRITTRRNGPPGVLSTTRARAASSTRRRPPALTPPRSLPLRRGVGDYGTRTAGPTRSSPTISGVKNLYRNLGERGGAVRFEDVAAAGRRPSDYGAGMSAAFLDYDNDGHLDIYTGNMWTADGQRVTASPAFMPGAAADVRAEYRQHVRGNGLYRNLGHGRFEDVTLKARANMGRWAWCSDTLDFDGDGWDDLYVANGMLTRADPDLDGFFWRQVVAQSPLTPVKGTPYDEAWRAINQLLIHQSIASRQRNVLLRNDGKGGFDEVSGTAGLDLEQDGRSFAVLDLDRDGDQDLAIMAARQAPQLRLFRNEIGAAQSWFSLRLTGSGKSNRDAIGARVVVETEKLTKTKIVQAGSGFLSQHSKTLTFALGLSERIKTLTVRWPSGAEQRFADLAPRRMCTWSKADRSRTSPAPRARPLPPPLRRCRHQPRPRRPPGSTSRSPPRPSPRRTWTGRRARSPRSPASPRSFCSGRRRILPDARRWTHSAAAATR
jgi:hypothetical protein